MSNEQNPFLSELVLEKLNNGIKFLYFFPKFKILLNGKFPLFSTSCKDEPANYHTHPISIRKFDDNQDETELLQFVNEFEELFEIFEKRIDFNFENIFSNMVEIKDSKGKIIKAIPLHDYYIEEIHKIIEGIDTDTNNLDLEFYKKKDEFFEYKLKEIENLIELNQLNDKGSIFESFPNFISILIHFNRHYPTIFKLKFSKYLDTDVYKEKSKIIEKIAEIEWLKINPIERNKEIILEKLNKTYTPNEFDIELLTNADVALFLEVLRVNKLINPKLKPLHLGQIANILYGKNIDNVRKPKNLSLEDARKINIDNVKKYLSQINEIFYNLN